MAIAEAIILAGGKGTRLQSLLSDIPKCMAPINGVPFISLILSYLKQGGISKIFISVGYNKEYIIKNLNINYSGMEILFVPEDIPLGTGGAVKAALALCSSPFPLVVNGDTFFRPDLKLLYQSHLLTNSALTIAVIEMPDVSRYGSVSIGENGRITSFNEKSEVASNGYINGGVYLMKNDVLESFPDTSFSLENDFLKQNVTRSSCYAFVSEAPFIDIGIPEDYLRAAELINSSIHDTY